MYKNIDLLPPISVIEEITSLQPDESSILDNPYVVIVYNDDYHTFEEVELQLQRATGCTLEKAEALSFEIHMNGRAIVYSGTAEKCEVAANILRQIRLQVETDQA